MMERQPECTLSDLCIHYLVKNHFDLSIEHNSSKDGDEWFDWTATRSGLNLYAYDPVRLVALFMISDDWIATNHPKIQISSTTEKTTNSIADYGNTYKYALDKLVWWGYKVSKVEDSADFMMHLIFIAEKDEKSYSATDPLRLLGLVAMIREYGENWARSDVSRSFSVEPVPGVDNLDFMWGKILDPEQIEEDLADEKSTSSGT
ncbi:MAG: hypothetical protein K1W30_05225 [Lachnospiraceae bacterium]